jgi:hypothetical protein
MYKLLILILLWPLASYAQTAADQATAESSNIAAQGDEPVATVAQAAAPTQLAASPEYQLVDLLGDKAQLLDIQSQLVDYLSSVNPQLDDYQTTVRAWAEQTIDWNEIREATAAMYRDNFTAQELEELLAFYRSPTGRKSVLLMPTLFRDSGAIGAQLAEQHKPELIDMLREKHAELATEKP